MANTILLKRDHTPNKVPLTTDLEYGEVCVNSYDGKLYTKRVHADAGSPMTDQVVLIGDPNGKTVQSFQSTIAAASGTTTIAIGATAPLITEGTEIATQTLTLDDVHNKVEMGWNMNIESSKNTKTVTVAFFRDSVCIGCVPVGVGVANSPTPFVWEMEDEPGGLGSPALGPFTYSTRIGVEAGAATTWRVNSPNGGTMGGTVVSASQFIIVEKT